MLSTKRKMSINQCLVVYLIIILLLLQMRYPVPYLDFLSNFLTSYTVAVIIQNNST